MDDTALEVVDVNQEQDRTEDSTLRNTAQDFGNKGVDTVYSDNLSSIGNEALYPGVDLSTDAIGPDLLKQDFVINFIEGLGVIQVYGISVVVVEKVDQDLVKMLQELGQTDLEA